MTWCCYIVRCKDCSFYTGITNNLQRRIEKHNKGTASKYTRCRRPVFLIYSEKCKDRSSALKREHSIKKLSRVKKEELIARSVLNIEVYTRDERVALIKKLMNNNVEDVPTPKTKDND